MQGLTLTPVHYPQKTGLLNYAPFFSHKLLVFNLSTTRNVIKDFYDLFPQPESQLLCSLYMQQIIQVLVISLVICLLLKFCYNRLWLHLQLEYLHSFSTMQLQVVKLNCLIGWQYGGRVLFLREHGSRT